MYQHRQYIYWSFDTKRKPSSAIFHPKKLKLGWKSYLVLTFLTGLVATTILAGNVKPKNVEIGKTDFRTKIKYNLC